MKVILPYNKSYLDDVIGDSRVDNSILTSYEQGASLNGLDNMAASNDYDLFFYMCQTEAQNAINDFNFSNDDGGLVSF